MKRSVTYNGRRLLAVLSLLAVLCALFGFPSFACKEGETGVVSAPIVVRPKDSVNILIKAKPGTTQGAGELKDSGTLTSIKINNIFTVTVTNHTNPENALYVRYTVNGIETVTEGSTFDYVCSAEQDYTTLEVRVYSKADDLLLKEYTFKLTYKELGFVKSLYWKIAGNETVKELFSVVKKEIPFAIWETFYVTVLSTFIALVIGMPLGVLLVVGDKDGILPLPRWIMSLLNVVINLLRSIPFLILMIMVIPLSRLIMGTSVGTMATIVPLVLAASPFVARLVETSLREVSPNIIEAAQSMGASPFKIIVKVMIPESVPSLISNITIAVTTILGYSAMSGAIGGGGLGQIAINYGYYRYQFATMIVAVVLLIVMVQIFQSIGTFLTKKMDRRLK